MKCLWRNKRTLYYATWEGMRETVDEDGNILETNGPIYSDPKSWSANISIEEGQRFVQSVGVEMFGLDIEYDKIIVTDNMKCPITESSVLWIDKKPTEGAYNYRVTRISKSLNSISIAVKRVEVS